MMYKFYFYILLFIGCIGKTNKTDSTVLDVRDVYVYGFGIVKVPKNAMLDFLIIKNNIDESVHFSSHTANFTIDYSLNIEKVEDSLKFKDIKYEDYFTDNWMRNKNERKLYEIKDNKTNEFSILITHNHNKVDSDKSIEFYVLNLQFNDSLKIQLLQRLNVKMSLNKENEVNTPFVIKQVNNLFDHNRLSSFYKNYSNIIKCEQI